MRIAALIIGLSLISSLQWIIQALAFLDSVFLTESARFPLAFAAMTMLGAGLSIRYSRLGALLLGLPSLFLLFGLWAVGGLDLELITVLTFAPSLIAALLALLGRSRGKVQAVSPRD